MRSWAACSLQTTDGYASWRQVPLLPVGYSRAIAGLRPERAPTACLSGLRASATCWTSASQSVTERWRGPPIAEVGSTTQNPDRQETTATRRRLPRSGEVIHVDWFSRCYDDHRGAVASFFRRQGTDPDRAADLTAETFVSALKHHHQLRGSSVAEERAWILAIARHQLSHYWRHQAVERAGLARWSQQQQIPSENEYERVHETIAAAGLSTVLAELLEAVPDAQALAVRLRVVDELDYRDLAGLTGVSEQVARARVSRGLAEVRRRLTGVRIDATLTRPSS